MHVLIPFAAPPAEYTDTALPSLELPRLQALLDRMELCATLELDDRCYNTTWETVLAQQWSWPGPDGTWPGAAWERWRQSGAHDATPCAWLTPCHWRTHTTGFSMGPPCALNLTLSESEALLQSLQPYLAQDGLRLELQQPDRWLAQGDLLGQLRCASVQRVIGRQVQDWLPAGAGALTWGRLQGEIQMLLYDHPVNDARHARGLPTVNALWLSGAGALTPEAASPTAPSALEVWPALSSSAQRADWAAWRSAWHGLDSGALAGLHARTETAAPLTLTLCGERQARSYRTHGRRWWQWRGRASRPQALVELRAL